MRVELLFSHVSLVDDIGKESCCLVLALPLKWNILSSVFLWTICYCLSGLCSFWLSPLVSDTPRANVRAYCLTLHNTAIQSLESSFPLLPIFPLLPKLRGVYLGQAEFQWAPNVDIGSPTCLPSPFGCEQSRGLALVIPLQQLSWRNAAGLVGSCLTPCVGMCEGVCVELRVLCS